MFPTDFAMPIQFYNSLTRKKEIFQPLNPPNVAMYTCGVTVYDDCHIGHARSLYIFDVMRRYLAHRGFKVNFVRNITDIDDKIINRANELKVGWKDLVANYIARYYEVLKLLRIEIGNTEPRATENIADMITYIQALIEKGYAYQAEADVYFNVRRFPHYGLLSGQSVAEMHTGVRIEPSQGKKDPLDFALWKGSKEGEPFWPSPWGKGRPGWHIECSVMSQKFLNTQTLDIHAGGRDLIFPHHENEIAQAQAHSQKQFAKYWIHHGLLSINGQKMSKSLKNFVTINDFIAKYKNVDYLKLFLLSAHYSHPIDYTEEKIEEAKKAYERIVILVQKLNRSYGQKEVSADGKTGDLLEFKQRFIEHMDDDFNTPRALSVLFELINHCNVLLGGADKTKALELNYACALIEEMTNILGLAFFDSARTDISDIEIQAELIIRANFKKEKKFTDADRVRKELEAKGIILEDTKDGQTTWRRKL